MINKRLLKEAEGKPFYLPVSILNAAANGIFIIINALFLSYTVDAVFLRDVELKKIMIYLGGFAANASLKFIVGLLLEQYIRNCAEDIKENIKHKTFKLLLSSSPQKVKEQNSGNIISLMTEGAEMLTPYYALYLPQFFASFCIPLLLCVTAAFIDRLSAVIMLITYPLIPLFMVLIGNKSKALNEKQWQKLTLLSSHFLDLLQGLRTLKIFGRSKAQEEKVFRVSENYRIATMEVLRVSFLSALVLESAATICTAMIAVNLGLHLVYDKISFQHAFFILILAPDFYLPLRQLGAKFHASLNGNVAIEKIDEIRNILISGNTALLQPFFKKAHFSIEIRGLSFCHQDKETLTDISFKINPGEKVALIGESGSGKSTLLSILCGFLEVADGMVFINGTDINAIDKSTYMDTVSFVPQHPHLFNGSLKRNILLGSTATEEEFMKICSLTKVNEFAGQFMNKYKTVIGDGESVVLSGGEKQRIALARALVKKVEFLILDEPTSAMDAETEELVPNLIYRELTDKTILIAAHRLNTVKEANKILVLHKGSIVESGTHEELIRLQGKYYQMIKELEVM